MNPGKGLDLYKAGPRYGLESLGNDPLARGSTLRTALVELLLELGVAQPKQSTDPFLSTLRADE